jgi:hypothetical protein
MEKKILYIDREAFMNWFFDYDIIKDFVYTYGVIGELSTEGTFSITAESLLEGAGYLPENLAVEGQTVHLDDNGEIDMGAYDEIKFYDFVASKTLSNGEV